MLIEMIIEAVLILFDNIFSVLCVSFHAISARMFRQIARYLPHHPDETDTKIHLKSSENKIKTASKIEIK